MRNYLLLTTAIATAATFGAISIDNANGLSAAEFIDEPFMVMDDNNTRAIDIQEWKEAYLVDVVPHLEPER